MTIRSRELSQFGSFIYIDDASKSISITTSSSPNVGIGTTIPQSKFSVVGNSQFDGNVSISQTLSVSNLDVGNLQFPSDGNINTSGIITASEFYLNGTLLIDPTTEKWGSVNYSDIFRLDGNVGIGTSIPIERLTVNGNIFTNNNLFVSGIATVSQLKSTAPEGTPPLDVSSRTLVSDLNANYLSGKTAPENGEIVGTTDTQTLSNKTLLSPRISQIFNNGILNIPEGNGTLVKTGAVGVVTSGMISNLSILNEDVAPNAAISYSKLNLLFSIRDSDISPGASITYPKLNLLNSLTNRDISPGANIDILKLDRNTISNVRLGENLFTLVRGTYLTGSNYNGSFSTTWSVDATPSNTSSKIVARDGLGNFSSNSITLSSTLSSNIVTSNTISSGSGGLNISGPLRDVNNNVGAAGSVLSSTGSSVTWIPTVPFPTGGIILWSGSIASIPSGWVLCDGLNGTPNLTDKFIIGSGGSYSPNTTATLGGYTGGTNAIYYSLAYIMKL